MGIKRLQISSITFEKGIDNTNPESDVLDGSIVAGENKELVGTDLRDRGGITKLNSTAAGSVYCTGIFNVPIEGAYYLITMYTDGKIYRETSSTRTQIGTGFNTGAAVRWSLDIQQDGSGDSYACMTNNNDEAQKWNPTKNAGDVSQLTASAARPTSSKIAISFGSRLWQIKGTVGYWSDLLDCGTYSSGGNHIYPDDGSTEMLGAFVYKGALFVGSQYNIHRSDYTADATTPFTHTGEYIVKGLSFYQNTVAEIDGYIYFLGTDGHFYIFDGVNAVPIDQKIKAYTDDMVAARKQYAWAVYYPNKREYICSIDLGDSDQNDTLLVANTENGVINPRWNPKWTGKNINCLAVYDSSGTKILYGGSSDATGYVYTMDSGSNDDGSPINAWFRAKKYNWGTALLEKHFHHLNLHYTGVLDTFSIDIEIKESGNVYSVNLEQEGDYLGGETEQDDDFWLGDDDNPGSWLVGEDEEVPDTFTELDGERAYTFQPTFTSVGSNATAKIVRLLVGWTPQKYR